MAAVGGGEEELFKRRPRKDNYHHIPPMELSRCVYLDGKHYPGRLCPHQPGIIEETAEPGWTVQQAANQEGHNSDGF